MEQEYLDGFDLIDIEGINDMFIKLTPGEYHVDFVVLQGTTMTKENEYITGEAYINGFVKWDGCSNILFSNENTFMHFCDPKDFDLLNKVMHKSYKLAWDKMKNPIDNITVDFAEGKSTSVVTTFRKDKDNLFIAKVEHQKSDTEQE